jgi:CheY-like chemotaxis protein
MLNPSTRPVVEPRKTRLPSSSEPNKALSGGNSSISLRGTRVLVVDDDRNTRELLGEILSLHDADVQTAESVSDAVTLYQIWRPNLLLSDLGMPGLDGYDLIRIIRALPGGDRITAVAITGYTDDEDRDSALAAGFNMYLRKPLDLDKLLDFIDSLDTNQ